MVCIKDIINVLTETCRNYQYGIDISAQYGFEKEVAIYCNKQEAIFELADELGIGDRVRKRTFKGYKFKSEDVIDEDIN